MQDIELDRRPDGGTKGDGLSGPLRARRLGQIAGPPAWTTVRRGRAASEVQLRRLETKAKRNTMNPEKKWKRPCGYIHDEDAGTNGQGQMGLIAPVISRATNRFSDDLNGKENAKP